MERMNGTTPLLPKCGDRKADNEHPEDDAVLASIRAIRELVSTEFRLSEDERRAMAAKLKAMRRDGGEQKITSDDKVNQRTKTNGVSRKPDCNPLHWKAQCYRLKERLEEEQERFGHLDAQHKRQILLLTRQLRETQEEATVDRDMKKTLMETLAAQQKYHEKLQLQLTNSRSQASKLGTKLKAVVVTMEEERESISKERDVALKLLEESREQLHQLIQAPTEESIVSQIRQLEETNARLLLQKDETESKSLRSTWLASTQSALAQTTSASALQQKLQQLENTLLAKNAKIIRSLQQQIASMERSGARSEELVLKKKQLRESKDRLRTKSLDVLGDTIFLQLQRLVEIHRQTTTISTQSQTIVNNVKEELSSKDPRKDEWEAALRMLAENRARFIALRETENLDGDNTSMGGLGKKRGNDQNDRETVPASKRAKTFGERN